MLFRFGKSARHLLRLLEGMKILFFYSLIAGLWQPEICARKQYILNLYGLYWVFKDTHSIIKF